MALKIFLADLIYDTIKTNYVVPLNVACLASCIKERYGSDVDITIFKYPKDLENKLLHEQPNILGLSNYSWNTRLNDVFINMVKRLNPSTVTVMGGPNIRIEPQGIKKYLKNHPLLDYYILYEGEIPFTDLIGNIINNNKQFVPDGCATVIDGEFIYKPINHFEKPGEINYPSPYLTGLLDRFLADVNMIPLLETNRGCPYGCVYCAWGIAALSRVYLKPMEVVREEINYIASKSARQPHWIFCDANFGLFPRDVEIAKVIREVADSNGFPLHVAVDYSKNTSERNIEISNILGSLMDGYIAIQSSDQVVLNNIGRGQININDMKKHINYYKDQGRETITDILIGLPGEDAKSHLTTLADAFNIGFDTIPPMNIRMLPGSKYDTKEYREKYQVKTKYRPIFGAYGIYDNQLVFEFEESIRATKDMSEVELNNFKVIHWLIYFAWNIGIFKPILQLGQKYDINPARVLNILSRSENPILKSTFDCMKKEAMDEWFNTPQEIIKFYNQRENFVKLVKNFVKLNNFFIALFYQDQKVIQALEAELVKIIKEELNKKKISIHSLIQDVSKLSHELICRDLLEDNVRFRKKYPGEIVSIVVNNPKLAEKELVEIEIYRPEKYISLSNFHLRPNGKKDFSSQNFTRFLEIADSDILRNKIRVINNE